MGNMHMFLFLCIFLLNLYSPYVCCNDIYESSLDFHGLSVRKNDLWPAIPADDMGACAKTCKLTKDCLSFTYNWISRDCRGHPEIFELLTGPFDKDSESQYYYSITYTPPTTTTPKPTSTTTKKGGGAAGNKNGGGGQVTQETTSIPGGQVTQETTTIPGGQVTQETTTIPGGLVTQETTTVAGGQVTSK